MDVESSTDLPLAHKLLQLCIALTGVCAVFFIFSKAYLTAPSFTQDPDMNIYALFGVSLTIYGCLKLFQLGKPQWATICYLTLLLFICAGASLTWGSHAVITVLLYFTSLLIGILVLNTPHIKPWSFLLFCLFLAGLWVNRYIPRRSATFSFSPQSAQEYGVFTSIAGLSAYAVFLQRKQTEVLSPLAKRYREFLAIAQQDLQPERFRQLLVFAETSEALLHAISKPLTAAQLSLEMAPDSEDQQLHEIGLEQLRFTSRLCRDASTALYDADSQLVIFPEETAQLVQQQRKKSNGMRIHFESSLAESRLLCLDRVQWQNALLNLLENAVREAQKQPESFQPISCVLSETNRFILLTVSNPGCIPKIVQQNLFQKRIAGSTSSGVGLLNTYSWLKRIGGHISCHSNQHSGTTFTLSIPKRPAIGQSCPNDGKRVVSSYARPGRFASFQHPSN